MTRPICGTPQRGQYLKIRLLRPKSPSRPPKWSTGSAWQPRSASSHSTLRQRARHDNAGGAQQPDVRLVTLLNDDDDRVRRVLRARLQRHRLVLGRIERLPRRIDLANADALERLVEQLQRGPLALEQRLDVDLVGRRERRLDAVADRQHRVPEPLRGIPAGRLELPG